MTISVILAIHRDDGFFDQAIASILSQTVSDFELLVIANNCSDELWAKILQYNDPRIIPTRLELGGLAFALNYGISTAKGKYIARMDADDLSLPNRFEEQLSFLETHPDIDILGTHATYINEEGKLLNIENHFPISHEKIIKRLPFKCPILHPSVMGKRDFFLKIGGYKYGLYAEDFELWIRGWLEGNARFHNLPQKLIQYRMHSNQLSSQAYNHRNESDTRGLLMLHFFRSKNYNFRKGSLLYTKTAYLMRLWRNKLIRR